MDTVANMLCAIYNAQAVGKPSIVVPYSGLKHEIVKVLEVRGFLVGSEKKNLRITKNAKPKPCLEITLKYENSIPAISGFKRISKPGQRIYKGSINIHNVKQGQGVGVLSTSKGLMTDREARKRKIGGEMLCEIW
jgi:small subunit ribosomal protein S8